MWQAHLLAEARAQVHHVDGLEGRQRQVVQHHLHVGLRAEARRSAPGYVARLGSLARSPHCWRMLAACASSVAADTWDDHWRCMRFFLQGNHVWSPEHGIACLLFYQQCQAPGAVSKGEGTVLPRMAHNQKDGAESCMTKDVIRVAIGTNPNRQWPAQRQPSDR